MQMVLADVSVMQAARIRLRVFSVTTSDRVKLHQRVTDQLLGT
jgi:hypothetical protein